MSHIAHADCTTPGAARLAHRRGDDSIRAAILGAIAAAPWLAADGVSVVVECGEVEFAGAITEPRVRTALREIASRCGGVRAVSDRLQVAGSPGELV